MKWERASIDAMLFRIFDFEIRLSPPTRPVYRGGVFILGMALGLRGKILIIATLAALIYLLGPWHGPLLLLLLVGVAMGAGALAGLAYGLLHPLARAGDFGVWLRWALSIYLYLLILAAALPHSPFFVGDPAFHLMAWVFAALGGLGLVLTDDRGASRLSPHQFKTMQNKVLLRAAPLRLWAAMRRKHWKYEARRVALAQEAAARPEAATALRKMLLDLHTDLVQIRRGIGNAHRGSPMPPDDLAELDAWIEQVQRYLEPLQSP